MNTIKYVKEHKREIINSLAKRKSDYPFEYLLKLEDQREQLTRAYKSGSAETANARKNLRGLGTEINRLLIHLPNILDESVPIGETEKDYVVMKREGNIIKRAGRSHTDILERHGLLDFEKAEKISGKRFYYLIGDLVLLEQALIRFAIDLLVKKGFTAVSPPTIIKNKYYSRLVEPKEFQNSAFGVSNTKEKLSLLTTSEYAVASMHSGEILPIDMLPLRYVALSPCFRKEADKQKEDIRSLMRVGQFYKIEQFVFSEQEGSQKYFNELLSNAEEIYAKLELPYEVVSCSSVDVGISASKKVDIGAYIPSQGEYREMVSCSNCTEWQSSRLNIKYVKEGITKYVHTLNSTALATTRTLAAIVENYSDKDGVIRVPNVLISYLGKSQIG